MMSDSTKCGCSCSETKKKNVLIYACSGGANVAEMSDRVSRQLMRDGQGTMFCLAGLGAEIPSMLQTAKDADLNLVIDGCPMDCARKIFEKQGLTNTRIIRVTDLGITKQKGVPVTAQELATVLTACQKALAEA